MAVDQPDPFRLSCPIPVTAHETVQLAHGGGGRLMRDLIEGLLLPQFQSASPEFPARPSARQRRV